jgi:chorismate mutase
MRNLFAYAALALALPSLPLQAADATHTPAPDALTPLIIKIKQRIDIGEEVALSKWYSGKPVQDTDREKQVIVDATSKASEFWLGKDDVRQFMTAQIEANKLVQYARLAQWHATGTAPEKSGQNLANNIRARLDNLQPELLSTYAAFVPYRKDVDCPTWVKNVTERQVTDPVVAIAMLRAAGELCTSSRKGNRS